ncbi:MAG: 1,2-phenylacetyl-CoA epoxidase subunit PaaC [Dehalococcoidia bacterium]
MTPGAKAALERYLMAMADDELVIGYRDTEWTGAAPMLEEDLAFSSIGLDEVGHARLFYSLLHDLTGEQIDYRARQPNEYLHAQFVERSSAPRYDPAGAHEAPSDWAFAIVRQYLYDLFDSVRLESCARSTWEPLASGVDKVRREERYHLQHGRLWLNRLGSGGPEVRDRLKAALDKCWPDALGLFEPVEGEALLVTEGLLGWDSEALMQRWFDALAAALGSTDIALPAAQDNDGRWRPSVAATVGGRRGVHSADWMKQWDDMTSVYRLDPAATW